MEAGQAAIMIVIIIFLTPIVAIISICGFFMQPYPTFSPSGTQYKRSPLQQRINIIAMWAALIIPSMLGIFLAYNIALKF